MKIKSLQNSLKILKLKIVKFTAKLQNWKLKILKPVRAFPKLAMAVTALAVLGSGAALASIGIGGNIFGNGDSVNLQQGLVGHWKMDGNAKDSTPNGNHGTVHDASLSEGRHGNSDSAYMFEESTTNLLTANQSDFNASTAGWGRNTPTGELSYNTDLAWISNGSVRLNRVEGNGTGRADMYSTTFATNLSPATTYTMSAYTYVTQSSTPLRFSIQWRDSSNNVISTSNNFNVPISTANSWERISQTYTSPAGTERALLILGQESLPEGEFVYFDGIQFEQKGYATSWVLGGQTRGDARIDVGDLGLAGDNTVTLSGWAKLDDNAPCGKIHALMSDGSSIQNGFYIHGSTCGQVAFRGESSSNADNVSVTPPGFNAKEWNHFVGVSSSSGLYLYINGVLVGSNTSAFVPINITNPYGFAHANNHPDRYLIGNLDDIRIYNRAINEAEITALYGASHPPSEIRVSDLQKDLVGHWDMNGDAKDRTPWSNHGTVSGATLTTDRHGRADSAYEFDALEGQWVQIDQNPIFNLESEMSVSVWAKPLVWNDKYRTIISKGPRSTQTGGVWTLRHGRSTSNSNQVSAGFRIDGISHSVIWTPPGGFDNQWHHYVMQYDGSSIKLYVDGVLRGENTDPSGAIDTNASDIFIGRVDPSDTDEFWHGSIEGARIYSRALSADEVNQLHDSYRPVIQMSDLSKGLVGHWDMNGDAKDRTPWSNHGTLTGTPVLATNRHGRPGSAYEFDGVDDYIEVGTTSVSTDAFTMSLWFNPSTWTTFDNVTQHSTNNANHNRISLERSNNWSGPSGHTIGSSTTDGITFITGNSSGSLSATFTTTEFATDTWYHIVTGWDASNTTFVYVNGVLENSGVVSRLPSSIASSFGIGRPWNNADGRFFNGKIDDVRVYNRALSAEEVKMLHETYR